VAHSVDNSGIFCSRKEVGKPYRISGVTPHGAVSEASLE
jgi:hypothetical protein